MTLHVHRRPVWSATCDGCQKSFTDADGNAIWLSEADLRSWLDNTWEWGVTLTALVGPACAPTCDDCGEEFHGTRKEAEAADWTTILEPDVLICPACQKTW